MKAIKDPKDKINELIKNTNRLFGSSLTQLYIEAGVFPSKPL